MCIKQRSLRVKKKKNEIISDINVGTFVKNAIIQMVIDGKKRLKNATTDNSLGEKK